jgi:hypothetical protein
LNFKFIIILFLFSSCGLKKNPIVPQSNTLPVISDRYKVIYKNSDINKEESENNKKKNTKKK